MGYGQMWYPWYDRLQMVLKVVSRPAVSESLISGNSWVPALTFSVRNPKDGAQEPVFYEAYQVILMDAKLCYENVLCSGRLNEDPWDIRHFW